MTRLMHFTLASEDVEMTKTFYASVFGDEFTAVEVAGEKLYRGSLAGLGMVICPTTMADVVANRSRHQLQLEVNDVGGALERAQSSGGRVHTPLSDAGGRPYAVICDPDNNTIELIGKTAESPG
ncbi:MAG: VOC family protein [Thermomicrobiales bacterium]